MQNLNILITGSNLIELRSEVENIIITYIIIFAIMDLSWSV